MKHYQSILIASIALLTEFSCNESSTNIDAGDPANNFAFKNVPWQLAWISFGDSVTHLETYEPFTFVVRDSSVYGYDGCNWYNGDFLRSGDSLQIFGIGSTEMGCGKRTINPHLLTNRWTMTTTDSTLILAKTDTTIIFSSRFTEDVHSFSFVDKYWILSSSNDSTFETLRLLDLLPRLHCTTDREFDIQWYFHRSEPYDTSNGITGVFGIGTGQRIRCFAIGGWYSHPNGVPSVDDWHFVDRIIGSTQFTFSDSTLTLIGQPAGALYQFTIKN